MHDGMVVHVIVFDGIFFYVVDSLGPRVMDLGFWLEDEGFGLGLN
jgi:hypothetical protein